MSDTTSCAVTAHPTPASQPKASTPWSTQRGATAAPPARARPVERRPALRAARLAPAGTRPVPSRGLPRPRSESAAVPGGDASAKLSPAATSSTPSRAPPARIQQQHEESDSLGQRRVSTGRRHAARSARRPLLDSAVTDGVVGREPHRPAATRSRPWSRASRGSCAERHGHCCHATRAARAAAVCGIRARAPRHQTARSEAAASSRAVGGSSATPARRHRESRRPSVPCGMRTASRTSATARPAARRDVGFSAPGRRGIGRRSR